MNKVICGVFLALFSFVALIAGPTVKGAARSGIAAAGGRPGRG